MTLKNILLANSNGTLIIDCKKVDQGHLAADNAALLERLAEVKGTPEYYKVFADFVYSADRLMEAGLYPATPVNGVVGLLDVIEEEGIELALFAAGSENWLEQSYRKNGLIDRIGTRISTENPELPRENNEPRMAMKTTETYEAVKALFVRQGKLPVTYISHKLPEADFGVEAFGHGLLIDPAVQNPERHRKEKGEIVVVPSLDHAYVRDVVRYLTKAVHRTD